MEDVCPLCRNRISNWAMLNGKVTVLIPHDPVLKRAPIICHNICLDEFRLKYGRNYDGKNEKA